MKKVLLCGKLFDSRDERILKDKAVVVENDRILEVGDLAPEGIEKVDLSGYFVMPGLIDAHVHTTDCGQASPIEDRVQLTAGDFALLSLKNAQADLMAGFTTLRDAGSRCFVDVALKNAVRRGDFDGPNMMVCGFGLTSTGGHADSHFSYHIKENLREGNVIDGPDEARRAVRYVLKNGADFIKFMATGGVMSKGTTVGAQQLTLEEMKAITETAEMYGVHTATHAHGTNGIKDAVRAGVTSVEHGMILDDECIQLMEERGTYLTPTIIAPVRIIENGVQNGIADWVVDKAKQVLATHKTGVQKCLSRGIRIAFGSDAGTPFNFHGKQAYEFELMCGFGLSPLQALTAATKTNAELLRMSDRVGSVEPGKLADIVAFKGDPMEDITLMQSCSFVMSRGKIIKYIN